MQSLHRLHPGITPRLLRIRRQRALQSLPRSTRSLSSNNSSESPSPAQRLWSNTLTHAQPWTTRVSSISPLLQRHERLRHAQKGVLHADPAVDLELLTDNYTVKAIASALRDREDALQQAALYAAAGNVEKLQEFLESYHPRHVVQRRRLKQQNPVLRLDIPERERLRKTLARMPRVVTAAHTQRAGVVVALGTIEGIPCVLLEKRASHLRSHPDEVCLPGGMVCDVQDGSIVQTCLREMHEEIGGLSRDNIEVLGVLRCNWGEIHHLVNVAVTPVVCFAGELPEQLIPNATEVASVFTIPLSDLLQPDYWIHKTGMAPIFVGGPEVIWGLCGYILERFARDVLMPNVIQDEEEDDEDANATTTEESFWSQMTSLDEPR